MSSQHVLDSVEAVVTGDAAADTAFMAHVESCAECRAAFEMARVVDRLLRARPAPLAPPDFTARVLGRARRRPWDWARLGDLFGDAAIPVLAAAGALWLLLAGQSFAADLAERLADTAASLPAVMTTALLAGALALWWWAEGEGARDGEIE